MPRPPGRRVKCHAHSKRTGEPCKNWAVTGWQVCRMHGARGGAPPGSMRGNTNSLRTGERAQVALSHAMEPIRIQLEAATTPQAMLRNLARVLWARKRFMYSLLMQAMDALDQARPTVSADNPPGPRWLTLRRMTTQESCSNQEWQIRQRHTQYVALLDRFIALNDAINRIEGQIGRVAEKLREYEGQGGPGNGGDKVTVLVQQMKSAARPDP